MVERLIEAQKVLGSIPSGPTAVQYPRTASNAGDECIADHASLAQGTEHPVSTRNVVGSNPTGGTCSQPTAGTVGVS